MANIVRFPLVFVIVLYVSALTSATETTRGEPHCPRSCTCSSHLKTVSCIGKNLQAIPDDIPQSATELYLSNNLLTEIPGHAFKGLFNLTTISLKQNHISTVDPDAFAGLTRLHTLCLMQNKIESLQPETFRDLFALRDLYLTNNLLKTIPDLTLAQNLTKLLLDTNEITSAKFAAGFKNLTLLSTLGLANNPSLTKITDDDFNSLPRSIRTIDLTRCQLTELGSHIFHFAHLQSVRLSYIPNWNVDVLRSVIDCLSSCKVLDSLDLAGTINAMTLPSDIFRNLSKVKLKTLGLAHMTGVDVIDGAMFQYLPHLENLDMSQSDFYLVKGSNITFMPKLQRLTLAGNAKLAAIPKPILPGLTFLDLTGCSGVSRLENDIFSKTPNLSTLLLSECNIHEIQRDAFFGLVNLEELDLSRNRIGGSSLPVFTPLQGLQRLRLGGNKMTMINGSSLFAPLSNLQLLDLSENQCSYVAFGVFDKLSSLRHIDLRGNEFGRTVLKRSDADHLFDGLSAVETIDLQSNDIEELPPNLFRRTVSLRTVNLTDNRIETWNGDAFNSSINLSVIDVSFNRISIVTQSMIEGLPSSAVKVNLTGNMFTCWCDLVWFRNWISNDPEEAEQRLPNLPTYLCNAAKATNPRRVLDFKPEEIKYACMWRIIVVAAAGVASVLIISSVVLVYRYRWSLRLKVYYFRKWFRVRRMMNGYENIDDVGSPRYDVLISYFPDDDSGKWVREELAPAIDRKKRQPRQQQQQQQQQQRTAVAATDDGDDVEEDGHVAAASYQNQFVGEPCSVFYEEYDVLPNDLVIGKIDEAMQVSTLVMIVVSENYVRDGRRKFEVDMALEHGHDRLIIVLWGGEEVVTRLPSVVQRLTRTNNALVWPLDNVNGQALFWQQLQERLDRRYEFMAEDRLVVNA